MDHTLTIDGATGTCSCGEWVEDVSDAPECIRHDLLESMHEDHAYNLTDFTVEVTFKVTPDADLQAIADWVAEQIPDNYPPGVFRSFGYGFIEPAGYGDDDGD